MTRVTYVKKARKDRGTCDQCRLPIVAGQGYAEYAPRYDPTRRRHTDCKNWNSWDLSNSPSAQFDRITSEVSLPDDFTKDDAEAALNDAAEQIREVAEEQREKASNIEEGFGHETYQSEELNSQADEIENFADEVESTDIDDEPVQGEEDDDETDEDFTDRMDTWRDDAREAVDSALAETPL